jgi:hypothetical protein
LRHPSELGAGQEGDVALKAIDLSGLVMANVKVLDYSHTNSCKKRIWNCVCNCGRSFQAAAGHLRARPQMSCGCAQFSEESRGAARAKSLTHGMTKTAIYKTWVSMLVRCADKSNERYGGRGISVCDRWLKFENFYSDMGDRPSNRHSIDRVNNDGNYEPANCRWATLEVQANNTSGNVPITAFGETKNMRAWASDKRCAVTYQALWYRIKAGWDAEAALTAKKHSIRKVKP